ncbi:immunogenic protein [Aeromonas hydrophila]|nr:immunogenic protein [Aeromonas hydrophila]
MRDVLGGRLKQFTRLHPALTALTLEGMQGEAEVPRHAGMADAPPPRPAAREPEPGSGHLGGPGNLSGAAHRSGTPRR